MVSTSVHQSVYDAHQNKVSVNVMYVLLYGRKFYICGCTMHTPCHRQRRVPLMSLPLYDALDPCNAGSLVSPLLHGSDELINYLGVSSLRFERCLYTDERVPRFVIISVKQF